MTGNVINIGRTMGDVRHEPSMEDILASIKRIIAEDGVLPAAAPAGRSRPRAVPDPEPVRRDPVPEEEVLELTEEVATEEQERPLVSGDAADASRAALARLATMAIRSAPGEENTLEGLVRELLKPMLKEWLDANLPELVETLVNREIARITGTSL